MTSSSGSQENCPPSHLTDTGMLQSRKTVAITGASGFIGRHVASRLQQGGVAVQPIVLPHDPQNSGGLEDRLRRELIGKSAVVHLAARVHRAYDPGERPSVYEWANVELTRILLTAAGAAGVGTFVFASSVKAVGEKSDTPFTEATIPSPVGAYAQSKLAGERIVAEQGRALGLRTVSLRFPLVYGPGMRANMFRLFRAVNRGVPLPLGAANGRRSLLYVGNAVTAIEVSLDDTGAEAGIFFVRDSEDVSTSELVRAVARSLGRPPHLMTVPLGLLRGAGRIGDWISQIVRCPIDSAMISRLLDPLQVDDSSIRARLGYAPRFSLPEGLADTAGWFVSLNGAD